MAPNPFSPAGAVRRAMWRSSGKPHNAPEGRIWPTEGRDFAPAGRCHAPLVVTKTTAQSMPGRDFYGFHGIYKGCGRRLFAGVNGWDFRLDMDEPTKAYYIGHITIHEEPRVSFWVAGFIRMEFRDRADEFADSLRTIVGDRTIEKALLPNCPT